MTCGSFVLTPKPLVLDVIIQDPKAEGGEPFRYPNEYIDEVICYPYNEIEFNGMFDPIIETLPKYICGFESGKFIYLSGWKENRRGDYKASVRALTRLAAFIRKNVKEMGEFWYTTQWIGTVPERPEDMLIIEMNIDDLRFAGEDIDSFEFQKDIFYKFVDV